MTADATDTGWRRLSRVGGVTALAAMLVAPAEVLISFVPGMDHTVAHAGAAADWFALFRANGFLGLRDLGLLNVAGAVLLMPTVLAIFGRLRREHEAWAGLAAILFFVGVAVYLAGNRAFVMQSLASQYWSATSASQKSVLLAAGQAVLAEGQSRSGLLMIEFSCLLLAVMMWKPFGKLAAAAGILGNAVLISVEIMLMRDGLLGPAGMRIAMAGGAALLLWYLLVGLKLLAARPA